MAKKEKKVLGLLPRGITTTLLLSLVVVVILALIWSWVMAQSWSSDNAWVLIVEYVILAILVGLVVGLLANNEKGSTLWIAAGLNALAMVVTTSFIISGMKMESVDEAIISALQGPAVPGADLLVIPITAGAIVLGIIAAACAAIGSRTKDVLNK